MVRITAEVSTSSRSSTNLLSSESSDRYKYRYGCGGGDAFTYKRPAHGEREKNCGDNDDSERRCKNINNRMDEINERNTRIMMMVEIRRNMQKLHEKQQKREMNEKSEKEKQEQRKREHEREQEERRKKEINTKLGKIIYKTRSGEVFEAYHSIHMTVNSSFDRKTRQMVQTYTEKIVWNDRVFESKQEWFSEINRQCASKIS